MSISSRFDFEQRTALRVLGDVAVIGFSGDDARPWLNGQVTSDIRELAKGRGAYALFTNAKGKILADAWVFETDDGMPCVTVPRGSIDALLASFDKYIIMEDVTPVVRDDLGVLVVLGANAKPLIAKAGLDAWSVYTSERLGVPGMDVVVSTTQLAAAEKALVDAGVLALSPAQWEQERIARAVPAFGIDFDEHHYPQEVGLKHAVSFQKGCYLGQEVVCMLENRGQVSRALVRLEGRGETLAAGTPLETADGGEIGTITSVTIDAGAVLALGLVKRAHSEPGTKVRAAGNDLVVAARVG